MLFVACSAQPVNRNMTLLNEGSAAALKSWKVEIATLE